MELIKKLRKQGLTKYKIAQAVGVTWQTVNMWEKEVFSPKPDKLKKLEELSNNQAQGTK